MRRRAGRPGPGVRRTPIIVLARDQAGLYEFLKERQEAAGKGRVVLDRRVAERRRVAAPVARDRRRADRRAPVPAAAHALMAVLGFAVLHPEGDGEPAGAARRGGRPRGAQGRRQRTSRRRPPAASPSGRRAGRRRR